MNSFVLCGIQWTSNWSIGFICNIRYPISFWNWSIGCICLWNMGTLQIHIILVSKGRKMQYQFQGERTSNGVHKFKLFVWIVPYQMSIDVGWMDITMHGPKMVIDEWYLIYNLIGRLRTWVLEFFFLLSLIGTIYSMWVVKLHMNK